MPNLKCNNCNNVQRAKVFETLFVGNCKKPAEFKQFFVLEINCEKCNQKKILSVGLTYLGEYIEFGYVRQKHFEKVEKNIVRELEKLPTLKKKDKKGFYLNYGEYGVIKRCYSNLSTLKLGIDPNLDMQLTQPRYRGKLICLKNIIIKNI